MDNPQQQQHHHKGYLATVEIGGNQFTKVGSHQYKIISMTVVSAESVILELFGMDECCVVVRDGSISLDFIVRLLLQETLNVYGNNNTTNTNTADQEQDISIKTQTTESKTTAVMDLSPLMDDAHLLREQVLNQREARFQFYLSEDDDADKDITPSSVSVYNNENKVPTAGDWKSAEYTTPQGTGFFTKALQAGKWISRQMIPRPDYWEEEEEKTIPFSNPVSWSSKEIETNHDDDENNPFLPFIKMLNNDIGDSWYAVSMLEFRCGQCETQNPLHSMLSQELIKRISKKNQSQSPTTNVIGRGIEYGTLTPDQSKIILKALHRTTPAICLTANAYKDLLQAVDHVLACFAENSDQKKAIEHLMKTREEVQHARACFFERRNLKEPSDPCCTAKKNTNNRKSKEKEKNYYY